MSGRKRSKLAGAQAFQLGLEVGDAVVGGSELAGAIEHFLLQNTQAMRRVAQGLELLAELVDLAGPARLVGLLAVFRQLRTFEGGRELRLQIREVARRQRVWRGRGWVGQGGLSEQTVDASDAAAVSMAALQLGAQFEASDGAASAAYFVDDLVDLGIRKAGRAGHVRIITENNGN
jgi:hypothetical protein